MGDDWTSYLRQAGVDGKGGGRGGGPLTGLPSKRRSSSSSSSEGEGIVQEYILIGESGEGSCCGDLKATWGSGMLSPLPPSSLSHHHHHHASIYLHRDR